MGSLAFQGVWAVSDSGEAPDPDPGLPLDSQFGVEVVEYRLRDSRAVGCGVDRWKKGFFEETRGIFIGTQVKKHIAGTRQMSSGVDLGYMMYTSGSTGNPKGVLIRQAQIPINEFASWSTHQLGQYDFFLWLSTVVRSISRILCGWICICLRKQW